MIKSAAKNCYNHSRTLLLSFLSTVWGAWYWPISNFLSHVEELKAKPN